MFRGLRAPLVLVFVVLLSHGPVSWGHTHRDLDPQQLQEHLQTFHADGLHSDQPSDWHYHLAWFQNPRLCQHAEDSGPETHCSGTSPLETLQWLCHANQRTPLGLGAAASDAPLRAATPPTSAALARSLQQRETYKLLGVLLI